jgi:uncharacterized protein
MANSGGVAPDPGGEPSAAPEPRPEESAAPARLGGKRVDPAKGGLATVASPTQADAERLRRSRARVARPLDFACLLQGIRDKYELAKLEDPTREFEALRARSEKGDAEAALALGLLLAYGEGLENDAALAAVYLQGASQGGVARATAELGRLYLCGNGVGGDANRAAALLTQAWQAGEPEGAYLLAMAHRHGLFDEADPALGIALLMMAAERGHLAAQKLVFSLRDDPAMSGADRERALDFLEAAAQSGDVNAMLSLADQFEATNQLEKAHAVLEVAAEAGSFPALMRLLALTKLELLAPGTASRLLQLFEAHAENPDVPPAALLCLAALETADNANNVTLARAAGHLRDADRKGSPHAALALALVANGMTLREAVSSVLRMSHNEAYSRFLQLREQPDSGPSPIDRSPEINYMVMPDLPAEIRAEGARVEIVVELLVGADGQVQEVKIVNTSHPVLGGAVEKAALKWRFTPAVRDGRPVSERVQIPVGFTPPR